MCSQLLALLLLTTNISTLLLSFASSSFNLCSLGIDILLCAEATCIGVIVCVQHLHEICPPAFTSVYLVYSMVSVAYYHRQHQVSSSMALCLALLNIATKCIILFTHEKTKWAQLYEHMRIVEGKEATRGLVTRLLHVWIHPILMNTHGNSLQMDNFDDLGNKILPENLLGPFEQIWMKCTFAFLSIYCY